MLVKKEHKRPIIVLVIVGLIIFYYVLRVMTVVEQKGGKFELEILNDVLDEIYVINTPLSCTPKNLGVAAGVTFFSWAVYECFRLQNKKNMQENTYGSAEWQSSDTLKNKKSSNIHDNIILTKTEQVSKNMKKSGLNRHILMVGRPGMGKSRYFFKPNILNATGGLIITDPKGELLRDCGTSLKMKGYDIKVLNLDKKSLSNHYNPFMYIRKIKKEMSIEEVKALTNVNVKTEEIGIKEDDVMTLISCIMTNTKSETIQNTTGDPFWEKCEQLFLQCIFYYILEEYKDRPQKQNFTEVLRLIRLAKPRDKEGNSELGDLFERFGQKYGENHIAMKQWRHFKVSGASEKMMSTIIMTATARLSCFNIAEVAQLVDTDDMELERIGMPINKAELKELNSRNIKKTRHGKVAYFVIIKPSDSTFNFIASLFYTQIFQMIDENAERCGGELKTPLDLYLDEFAQLGEIPQFQEELAYVRGLNVGVVICLQSLSQLKKLYKDYWETILDCCDTTIFLGSRSKETLEYFVTILGKKTWYKKSSGRTFSRQGSSSLNWDVVGRELATIDELEKLKKGHCVLFIANIGAFYSELYDLKEHPDYKYLYEPWDSNTKKLEYKHNPSSHNEDRVEEVEERLDSLGLPHSNVLPDIEIGTLSKEEEKYIKKYGYSAPQVLSFLNKK